jgi:hypothetical protein
MAGKRNGDKMRLKLSVCLIIFLCPLCLAACGLGGGEPIAIEPKGPYTEETFPGQVEPGSEPESVLIVENEPDPVIRPSLPVETGTPETLRLRNRFLVALLKSDYILDASVEMGIPVYAEARLDERSIGWNHLSLFSNLYLANPGWWLEREGYSSTSYDEATETDRLHKEMILTLIAEPSGGVYQYHYHDDIWDAIGWPEDELPFLLEYETAEWDSNVKRYGEFVEGEEIFNEDDFYAIYRELGLESDGLLPRATGVVELLGMPERFFARYEYVIYSDTYLYLVYPFGEISFQDITMVKLTNDSVSGPRGTRVGDHYEDVIAKFLREENRDDNYFYEFVKPDTPPYYGFLARGEIFYSGENNEVTRIRYTNGRSNVEYEIEDDLVVSISTIMFVDGY